MPSLSDTNCVHTLSLTLPLWVWVAVKERAENDGLTVSAEIRIILANAMRGMRDKESSETLSSGDSTAATGRSMSDCRNKEASI